MEMQRGLGNYPDPRNMNLTLGPQEEQIELFCIKVHLKENNRFLYINVIGSIREQGWEFGSKLSKDSDRCKTKSPYKIYPAAVHWVISPETSRDCVLDVTLLLKHFSQLYRESHHCDKLDKMVNEWLAILNSGWKEVKGMDAISELEIDTTKNFAILNYTIYPTYERISKRRFIGRHEVKATQAKNTQMNKFLSLLKESRPDPCDWPVFTDETELFCVQVTCTKVGRSLFLNFLGTSDNSKLDYGLNLRYKYSSVYWRKGCPNYDLVAFATVNRDWFHHSIKLERRSHGIHRRRIDRNSFRHHVVDELLFFFPSGLNRFHIRTCLDEDCDWFPWTQYSILGDGEFVEPSPCYAYPEHCLIDPNEEIEFFRPTANGTFIVSVKLRRMPDKIRFNDDLVEIFDGIWTAIAKFHLPILVDLTKPLEYRWDEEERTLYLEFKVYETLDP